MSIRWYFFIAISGTTAALVAADKAFLEQQGKLCHSTPIRTSRENSEKTPLLDNSQKQEDKNPAPHRNSAPARFSVDEKKDSKVQLSGMIICRRSSGPLSGSIKNSPTTSPKVSSKGLRTSNAAKKYCFINAEQIDCNFLEKIRHEVKKVATEANLKKSNFYHIFRQMRPELIQSNAVAFVFANYFICMVAQHESCKKHLDVRGSQYVLPSTGDFIHCVGLIRSMVNTVTSNSIVWPSVAREDHLTRYYQELLENNKMIDASLVCAPYLGSVIAAELLKQAKGQSDAVKAFFSEITSDSPKRAKKYCKELVAQFTALQVFVPSLNVQFHKLVDQEDHG